MRGLESALSLIIQTCVEGECQQDIYQCQRQCQRQGKGWMVTCVDGFRALLRVRGRDANAAASASLTVSSLAMLAVVEVSPVTHASTVADKKNISQSQSKSGISVCENRGSYRSRTRTRVFT